MLALNYGDIFGDKQGMGDPQIHLPILTNTEFTGSPAAIDHGVGDSRVIKVLLPWWLPVNDARVLLEAIPLEHHAVVRLLVLPPLSKYWPC